MLDLAVPARGSPHMLHRQPETHVGGPEDCWTAGDSPDDPGITDTRGSSGQRRTLGGSHSCPWRLNLNTWVSGVLAVLSGSDRLQTPLLLVAGGLGWDCAPRGISPFSISPAPLWLMATARRDSQRNPGLLLFFPREPWIHGGRSGGHGGSKRRQIRR